MLFQKNVVDLQSNITQTIMARLQNQYIFNEILDRLSGLASNIKLRASSNLLDSNVLSEDFYLGLLNLVYGWNLHNANSDVQNVQGIDLIDRNRKIVVQVTSTCLKAIYKQAQRFVPDLHHTFEQLLEYHNSMLVRKADFIADELPTIENQIVKLETRIDELHKSEKVLSQKLTQSVSYVDYENLVTELTQKYERMGSLKQQIEQIDKVEERIERLKQKLADINGVLFTEEFKGKVQKQLDKLNFYLSRISQRLYGEQYGMVFEIQAAKNRTSEIFRFDVKRLDADTVNFSSGKKQGEIVCFDMAYILFADQEKIPCFHFGLYDKKELLHSNQLLKISTLLEENVNLQFVASILSDKLPKGLKNDRYIIVKLSQKDKLFKF